LIDSAYWLFADLIQICTAVLSRVFTTAEKCGDVESNLVREVAPADRVKARLRSGPRSGPLASLTSGVTASLLSGQPPTHLLCWRYQHAPPSVRASPRQTGQNDGDTAVI